jgi:hypothetical protein
MTGAEAACPSRAGRGKGGRPGIASRSRGARRDSPDGTPSRRDDDDVLDLGLGHPRRVPRPITARSRRPPALAARARGGVRTPSSDGTDAKWVDSASSVDGRASPHVGGFMPCDKQRLRSLLQRSGPNSVPHRRGSEPHRPRSVRDRPGPVPLRRVSEPRRRASVSHRPSPIPRRRPSVTRRRVSVPRRPRSLPLRPRSEANRRSRLSRRLPRVPLRPRSVPRPPRSLPLRCRADVTASTSASPLRWPEPSRSSRPSPRRRAT